MIAAAVFSGIEVKGDDDVEDRKIVERLLARDESALAEAQKAHGRYCLYIAQNVVSDRMEAESCLNEALLAAWNSIPPHEPANLKTYLGKLTRQTSIDRLRSLQAQKRGGGAVCLSLDELEEVIGESDVESSAEEAELARAISAFLRTVRESDRNVFIRRYWYCDSVESICGRYGFGKSRVLMALKRTRDKLAAYLKKEGYLI